MRVLIADFDLYLPSGGGQTVARRLIEAHPQIEFHYGLLHERRDQPRPPNARVFPFRRAPGDDFFDRSFWQGYTSAWVATYFVESFNFARCAPREHFDAVIVADYQGLGAFLRPALRHHGVDVDRIVLALHGDLSQTMRLNWAPNAAGAAIAGAHEGLQVRTADQCFGISPPYVESWRRRSGRDVACLDPLAFMPPLQPKARWPRGFAPELFFVGRTERCKGPDVFVELLSWLRPGSYRSAAIIGEASIANGANSSDRLAAMIKDRRLPVRLRPPVRPIKLAELYGGRSLVVLPSRYDTLNLVVLEALSVGCPVVVGEPAGVCEVVRQRWPELPLVTVDPGDPREVLAGVARVLEDYDAYRERLVEALQVAPLPFTAPSFEQIVDRPSQAVATVVTSLQRWFDELLRRHEAAQHDWRHTLLAPARRGRRVLRELAGRSDGNLGVAVAKRLKTALTPGRSPEVRRELTRLRQNHAVFAQLGDLGSRLDRRLLHNCHLACEVRVDRAQTWSAIAEDERERGNTLLSTVYDLRVMRALGDDRLGRLPLVADTLRDEGFVDEADAAEAMFGKEEDRYRRCAQTIERAVRRGRARPWAGPDYELVDDRRHGGPYRASVLVSLYGAADKLAAFLRAIAEQTLLRQGAAEVVIVETASPKDDYGVFCATMQQLDFPVVYARVPRRETIQATWNRALGLARAPYITCLGVDEMLLPRGLERLSDALDRWSDVDWVQADSLVVDVDEGGGYLRDVMSYDRAGYTRDSFYLDTCYLTWVGGLYRRSIHERLGYYDGSFRAAGDTEFKSRVLPGVRSAHLPERLGLYWNYSDARASQSYLAELEDLRAWYLYRTPAGVAHAVSTRDSRAALDLYRLALDHRKSFHEHKSTDIELAVNIGRYLKSQGIAPRDFEQVSQVLDLYRRLDWITPRTAQHAIEQLLAVDRQLVGKSAASAASVFNDNRHQQHTHTWLSHDLTRKGETGRARQRVLDSLARHLIDAQPALAAN